MRKYTKKYKTQKHLHFTVEKNIFLSNIYFVSLESNHLFHQNLRICIQEFKQIKLIAEKNRFQQYTKTRRIYQYFFKSIDYVSEICITTYNIIVINQNDNPKKVFFTYFLNSELIVFVHY
jgi:hypothetical protein